jgi:hypothetical protein
MNWQERETHDMLGEEQPDEDVFFWWVILDKNNHIKSLS